MKKIILSVLCILVTLSFFTACTSKEAKEVISDINSLGEITLDSYEQITTVTAKYEALESKDKNKIKNIDILYAAQEKYQVLDLESRMQAIIPETAPLVLSDLNSLLDEYNKLSEEQRSYFTTSIYDEFELIIAVANLESRVRTAISQTYNITLDDLQSLISEYNSLTTNQRLRFNRQTYSDLTSRIKVLELEDKMRAACSEGSDITITSMRLINNSYNNLSQKEKGSLNSSVYISFKSKYTVMDLDSRIRAACNSINSESYTKLVELRKEYNVLNSTQKKEITNYTLLTNSIEKSKPLYAKKKVEEIVSKANGDYSSAQTMYKNYCSLMSEEQKVECLLAIGRWMAFDKAEKHYINNLKYPSSYVRYSGKTREPKLQAGYSTIYTVVVILDCSGMNSFGGMTRSTEYIDVEFGISTYSGSITIYSIDIR